MADDIPDPCPSDPALDVVNAYSLAMREAFSPDGRCPPPTGGSNDVRFLAGEGPALVAFDLHTRNGQCKEPFLWVRVARRYRTDKARITLTPVLDTGAHCGALPRVVAIEVGVARCSVAVNEKARWDDYEMEAQRGLDDSWRLELALCRAASRLRVTRNEVASDVINPVGPDGGIVAWVATAYVRIGD